MSERNNSTWRKLILKQMAGHGDTWDDVVSCTLSDAKLDVVFDFGLGGPEGEPFTLWTKRRVYFPAEHDGYEWCRSAPRDPCEETTPHDGEVLDY